MKSIKNMTDVELHQYHLPIQFRFRDDLTYGTTLRDVENEIDERRKFYIFKDYQPTPAAQADDGQGEAVDLAANLDHVSTQWVQLHQELSTALGLDFEPNEDIERYTEAIAALREQVATLTASRDEDWRNAYQDGYDDGLKEGQGDKS